MRSIDVLEGGTYHFVATADAARQHLEGKPFTVAKKVLVHRRNPRGGRKLYRVFDAAGGWAYPDELEPIPDDPCKQCQVGEMQQVGNTQPNGTVNYECTVCKARESFP